MSRLIEIYWQSVSFILFISIFYIAIIYLDRNLVVTSKKLIYEEISKIPIDNPNAGKNYKTIALWSSDEVINSWGFPKLKSDGFLDEPRCSLTNFKCKILLPENLKVENFKSYDAILIDGYGSGKPLPKKRLPHQLYGFVMLEPHKDKKLNFEASFNLTSKWIVKFYERELTTFSHFSDLPIEFRPRAISVLSKGHQKRSHCCSCTKPKVESV